MSVAYTVPAATPGGDQTDRGQRQQPRSSTRTPPTTARPTRRPWSRAASSVVTKDDGLASVVAGTSGHAYTISVTNPGPSDADSVSRRRRGPGRADRRAARAPTSAATARASAGNTIALQPAGQPRPRRDLDDHRAVRRRLAACRPRRSATPPPPRATRTRPVSAALDDTAVTTSADLAVDGRRRPGQRRRRRRAHPRLHHHGQQRRALGRQRGQPRRGLAGGLQPGPRSARPRAAAR